MQLITVSNSIMVTIWIANSGKRMQEKSHTRFFPFILILFLNATKGNGNKIFQNLVWDGNMLQEKKFLAQTNCRKRKAINSHETDLIRVLFFQKMNCGLHYRNDVTKHANFALEKQFNFSVIYLLKNLLSRLDSNA